MIFIETDNTIKKAKNRKYKCVNKSNDIIGIAKKSIADNEYCCNINLQTGEIKSDKIKFLPWGKKKLFKKLMII